MDIERGDPHYIELLRQEGVSADREELLYEMQERLESSIKGSIMGSMTGSDLQAP